MTTLLLGTRPPEVLAAFSLQTSAGLVETKAKSLWFPAPRHVGAALVPHPPASWRWRGAIFRTDEHKDGIYRAAEAAESVLQAARQE